MIGWCSYVLIMFSTVDVSLLEPCNVMVAFPVAFCTIFI